MKPKEVTSKCGKGGGTPHSFMFRPALLPLSYIATRDRYVALEIASGDGGAQSHL